MNENFDRYLALLKLRRETPSIDNLTRVIRAHLWQVPFENVSKLYYFRTEGLREIPPFNRFLDGIERYHFGGTCYANGFHLHRLLRYLGYDVDLCGADMSHPDVHLVNIVRIDGREFIVDVGYAAPFIEPLPRDLQVDYIIASGADRYVLSPMDAVRRSRLTFFHDGSPRHGYQVNPTPRRIEEFGHVIAESFRPEATFMNALLLVRCGNDSSQTIRNTTFTESRGTSVRIRKLDTIDEVIDLIEQVFSIPAAISHIALDGLAMDQSTWD